MICRGTPTGWSSASGAYTGSARPRFAIYGTLWRARPARVRSTRGCLRSWRTARETLGGKVYDVLGELFEARPLRELFMEAIRYGDRQDVRERLFEAIDGAVDIENIDALVARNKLTREGLDPTTGAGRP